MKLETQFTVPKKEKGSYKFKKNMGILEKNLKKECINYPSPEDCLVCCE